MLNKIGGLARALYIVLAVVAGFVALGTMDVALVLVVLGLIAGISMPKERMVLAAVTIIALPIIGAALGHIPAIGAQLTAVAANLQLGMAGAFATAIVIVLYELAMDGVTGLAGSASRRRGRAAATDKSSSLSSGSAASRGGAFSIVPPRRQRGLHQRAGARGLDLAAEALLHQRHDAAHVLHR